MYQAVLRGAETGQHAIRRTLRRGEGRAVDGAAQLREGEGLHSILGEDVNVVAPRGTGVGTFRRVGVVVARRDDRLSPELRQRLCQQGRGVAAEIRRRQTGHPPAAEAARRGRWPSPPDGSGLRRLSMRRCRDCSGVSAPKALSRWKSPACSMRTIYASSGCQPLHTSTHCDEVRAAAALQLIAGQLDGAGGAAHGGEHGVEPLQGHIQIRLDIVGQGKGAHTAHGVADALHRLLGGEHLGLGAEEMLILAVVHLGVAGGHDEDGILPHLEAQGLGDPRALHAHGQSRQLHRGAGHLELTHTIGYAVGCQVFSHFFNRHDGSFFPRAGGRACVILSDLDPLHGGAQAGGAVQREQAALQREQGPSAA